MGKQWPPEDSIGKSNRVSFCVGEWGVGATAPYFLVVLHIFMLCVVFFPCTVLRTLGWSTDDYVEIDGQCISKIGDEAGLANAIWRDKASMRSVPTN